MKRAIQRIVGMTGFKLSRADDRSKFADLSPAIVETIFGTKQFTMTSLDRLAALCAAVEYVTKYNIEGDFVECGVWKGGSCMAAALTFARLNNPVPIWLYDTFEGMSEPTAFDREAGTGRSAIDLLAKSRRDDANSMVRAYSSFDEVRKNLSSVRYQHLNFVKGKVEETIPGRMPDKICILRLDTDWYESTKHELTHLFPRLVRGGVLIVDDYGHWEGARKAVDEFFADSGSPILLNRIDYSGRIGIKI